MSSSEHDSSLITIKVASPVAIAIGKLSVYTVARDSTVLQLKTAITNRFPSSEPGPTPDRQRLIFRGKLLENTKKISEVLKENSLQNASSIHFHLAIKPLVDAAAESGSNRLGGPFTNRFFGSASTPPTSAFGSSSNATSSNIGSSTSSNTRTGSGSSNISIPVSIPATSNSRSDSQPSHMATTRPTNSNASSDRAADSEVFPAPVQQHFPNIWTSSSSFGPSADTVSSQTSSPSITPPVQSTTALTPSFAFNSSNSVFDPQPQASSASARDLYTTQVPPQNNAGILDLSRFSFSVTESGARTVNFVGPHDIIIPVPVEQVAFIRNHANELLCCLAPEAIVRLSNILHRPVEPEPLSSRTPIYTDSATGLPTYNPNLPVGRNLYLSTPVVRSVSTPTQPIIVQPEMPVAEPAPAADQPLNGIRIGFGARTFDINAQFFRNHFGFMSFLLRVIIVIDLVVMDFSPKVQVVCVAAGLIIALLWSNNIIQRVATQVTESVRNILFHMPHGNPAVPIEADQPQRQGQEQQQQQQQQPRAVEANEQRWNLKEFALSVKRFVLMFVGSLIPFVYDIWLREEAIRREHAERIAEHQRLEQQQEEEQHLADAQQNAEQQNTENLNDPTEQLENDALRSDNSSATNDSKIPEVLRAGSPEPLSDAPAGPSGSTQYQGGEDQTLLHRNV
jgi:hypothetical protein